jgi:hypothetical protein
VSLQIHLGCCAVLRKTLYACNYLCDLASIIDKSGVFVELLEGYNLSLLLFIVLRFYEMHFEDSTALQKNLHLKSRGTQGVTVLFQEEHVMSIREKTNYLLFMIHCFQVSMLLCINYEQYCLMCFLSASQHYD